MGRASVEGLAKLSAVLLIAMTTSGFQSMDDAIYQRWQSFIGLTVNQFSIETGLWVQNMYDNAEGRVFVIEWQRPLGPCNIQLHATYNGAGANADGWTIYRTVHQGPCGGI